jgi:hypothetical protein
MNNASLFVRRAVLALLILVAAPCGVAIAGTPPVPASTLQPAPEPVVMAPVMLPVPDATGGLPWAGWILVGLAALAGLETAVRGLRAVFGVVAPRTKNTVDDSIRDGLGKVDDTLLDVLHVLRRLAPAAPPAEAKAPDRPPATRLPGMGQGAVAMPIPGSGMHRGPGVLLIALMLGGMATQVSCATAKAAPTVAGHAIVDCAKADAAGIFVLLAQLGAEAVQSALDTDAIDWPAIEASAWAHGKIIGGCAASQFVAALSSKQPAVQGLVAAPDPGREALARLSARWGGVEWRTGAAW